MKRNAVRVLLVVAMLGALAAIPASTQGFLGKPESSGDKVEVSLPMVLLVNRLELSRQQMETLRLTIDGLLDQVAVLDQKRGVFEQEMIAFHGTAEELNARLVAFRDETNTDRVALDDGVAAAVATLKETLTMKQGEILMAAFPRIAGRLDAVSSDSTSLPPQARAGSLRAMSLGPNGRMMMRGGQAATMQPSVGMAAEAPGGSTGVADKIQTLVERLRERVAERLTRVATAAPSAGTASATARTMMRIQGDGRVSGKAGELAAGAEGSGDFGAVTISLSSNDSSGPVERVARGGERSIVRWLERFAQVLELKLAATT